MAKINFETTVEIVTEFFENALDGTLSFEEYCNVYGHTNDTARTALENYAVCVKTAKLIKLSGLTDSVSNILSNLNRAKIETEFYWNELEEQAKNNAILLYKDTFIENTEDSGGYHLYNSPIEKQIEYMRELLASSAYIFDKNGRIIA